MKRLISLFLAMTCMLSSVSCAGSKNTDELPPPKAKNENIEEIYTICHGMGGIDGHSYLNSFEGFEYMYNYGFRVFEVDFQRTSDGKLACVHDWTRWNKWTGTNEDSDAAPDYETFRSKLLFDEYTPFDIYSIAQLMLDYPDIALVTDTKTSDNDEFRSTVDEIVAELDKISPELKSRLIIQAYNEEQIVQMINDDDIQQFLFTTYDSGLDAKGIAKVMRKYKDYLWAVTTPDNTLNANHELADVAHECGLMLYVHTINTPDMVLYFLDLAADGIYTDGIIPDEWYRYIEAHQRLVIRREKGER